MMQRRSQTVNITLRACLSFMILASVLFRRRIARCTKTCRIFNIFYLKFSCGTKVDQCDLPVRPQHDIRWFQISIYNWFLPGMQIIQYIAQLDTPGKYILDSNRQSRLFHTFFQNFIQGFSLDIVHNNQECIFIVNYVNDTRQIFVIQSF